MHFLGHLLLGFGNLEFLADAFNVEKRLVRDEQHWQKQSCHHHVYFRLLVSDSQGENLMVGRGEGLLEMTEFKRSRDEWQLAHQPESTGRDSHLPQSHFPFAQGGNTVW